MCADCVNQLPRHIKFELWRPMEDGFVDVHKDAHKYLTSQGLELDTITYPGQENKIVEFLNEWW